LSKKGEVEMNAISPQKLLTEKEVANLCSVSVSTLRNDRWLGKGMPYVKIGKSVRYDIDSIFAYLEQNKIEPNT
jgi:hypothetical protein